MALSKNIANIVPAGITAWKVKDLTRPDDAYCYFLTPRDASLNISSLGVADGLGRVRNHAFQLSAKAKIPIVRTQAQFLDLLPSLGSKELAHSLTLFGSGYCESALDTANPSWGFKWKMVSDPSLDSDWYVEIEADRKMNATAVALIMTDSEVATGTPNAADTFYAMRSLAVSDIAPAGITKIEIGTSYASDMDFVRNGRFTAELLTVQDDLGRSHGYAIKCDYEADLMQATFDDEYGDIDTLALTANDTRITFANGSVFTAASALGFSFNFTSQNDTQDIRFIRVTGSGVVALGSWAGLWS